MEFSSVIPMVDNNNYVYDAQEAYKYPVVDAPGYVYEWVDPIQSYVVKYEPIPGFYSPPIFDTNLSWYQISVPKGMSVGSLKGDGALHFENPIVDLPFEYRAEDWYSHWSGATYVFYREDIHKIEIWSSDVHSSVVRIVGWLEAVQTAFKSRKMSLKKK